VSIQNISRCHTLADILAVFIEQLRVRSEHTPRGADALGGDMTIEALPTWYAGITFRSRLEADWAATLDSLGITWEYEPATIALPSGATYIPDFRLPELGTWIEVKGTGVPRVEKAVQLGEILACHCEGSCSCEWPGGQIVLIGHPPQRYDAAADPRNDGLPHWALHRRAWRHCGHPAWSSAYGPETWLLRCQPCGRAGFASKRWPLLCRACGARPGEGHTFSSGETGLEFVNSDAQPAPIRPGADTREAA
jgi:hypothetical protein